jgi:ketosteroid isomerase-like protein
MTEPQTDLVELTRRSMMDANDSDFAAAAAVFADDAVFDVSDAGIGRFEGRDAVRGYLEDWIGSFERQGFTSWEGTDLGAGYVFVDAVFEGSPAGSDAHVRERWAFRVRWDHGRISEVLAAQDVVAALEAARSLASAGGAR